MESAHSEHLPMLGSEQTITFAPPKLRWMPLGLSPEAIGEGFVRANVMVRRDPTLAIREVSLTFFVG